MLRVLKTIALSVGAISCVEGKDMKFSTGGIEVKISGKSGKFKVYRKNAGENEINKIDIEMDALREVDINGSEVGKRGKVKHSIGSFAKQDFEFTKPKLVNLGYACWIPYTVKRMVDVTQLVKITELKNVTKLKTVTELKEVSNGTVTNLVNVTEGNVSVVYRLPLPSFSVCIAVASDLLTAYDWLCSVEICFHCNVTKLKNVTKPKTKMENVTTSTNVTTLMNVSKMVNKTVQKEITEKKEREEVCKGANASIVTFNSPISGIGHIKVDTFIVDTHGVAGPDEDSLWAVAPGDMKFNIELFDWKYCGSVDKDGNKTECVEKRPNEQKIAAQFGEFIDIDIKIKGKKPKASKKNMEKDTQPKGRKGKGKKQDYELGAGVNLLLTNLITIDGNITEMPAGYPMVRTKGKDQQIFTFRIPKFAKRAVYDPIATTGGLRNGTKAAPGCNAVSLAKEYAKCIFVNTVSKCTLAKQRKVTRCACDAHPHCQKQARTALAVCKMAKKADCETMYTQVTGRLVDKLEADLEAARGAMTALADEMVKCGKNATCKHDLRQKLGNVMGRKITKAELAGKLREAGKKVAGEKIKACIAAATNSSSKEACLKSDAARKAFALAAGLKEANIKDEDLKEALHGAAIDELKKKVKACVKAAAGEEATKKGCFKLPDVKSIIANSKLVDASKVKDSTVRRFLKVGAQKDLLEVVQGCSTDAQKCKDMMKQIKADSLPGKRVGDVSDDELQRDVLEALRADLGEKMLACVEDAGANKTAREECRSTLAKTTVKLGNFMKTVPSAGEVQEMLEDAARQKSRDVMRNCGGKGSRAACLQTAKERIAGALGKVKDEVTTMEVELFSKHGAIEDVKDSALACAQAKKENSSATCDNLYDTYLSARAKAKPNKKSEQETQKHKLMARAQEALAKSVRTVCFGKGTKLAADACLKSFMTEMDDVGKELFGAANAAKRMARQKRAETKASTDYLGQRLSACMKVASDTDAKKSCLKALDEKKVVAGVVESQKDFLKRYQARLISEAATTCEATDRKGCVDNAKKSFAKLSGLKARVYNKVKQIGEFVATAESYAACKQANQTDADCEAIAQNEFKKVSGATIAAWAKVSARVMKLAQGMLGGADVVMRKKMQLAIDMLTKRTSCEADFEHKFLAKIKAVNFTFGKTLKAKSLGCRVVDGVAEYSAIVGTTGLDESQTEAAADELSTTINSTEIARRLTEVSSSTFVAQDTEACSSSDTTCGQTDSDLVVLPEPDDKMNTANGVSIKVLGKSGKFQVFSAKAGQNDPSRVTIEMDALREVDGQGNAVGKTHSTKHSIQTFAAQAFTFSQPETVKLGANNTVSATKLSFTSPISSIGTIKVDTFIMTSAGVVGPEGENWATKPGDVKFNIELSKWTFCGCKKGQTNEVGEYVDIDIKMKGKNNLVVASTGKKQSYLLGGGVTLKLTQKVMIDGEQKMMPAGYPKMKGDVFTFRFPKFTKSALYDPLLSTGSSVSHGLTDHAVGLGCSPVVFFILAIPFLMVR